MTTDDRPNLFRTFNEASPEGDTHGELLRALRKRRGKSNDWSWLLASRVIVILNEAGAGKTAELMDQARRLRDGQIGFFLRIERLCAQAFETAFESHDEYLRFERWRRGKGEAVIFLDSVDEAKLPRDLDSNPLSLAIRRVEQRLSGLTHRTRFVISSRPSAWTPELELAEVRRLADTFRSRGIGSGQADAPTTRFVTLAPLDADQRRTLAEWAKAPVGFLETLGVTGAVEFARTPLDLLDLVKAYSEEVDAGRSGEAIFESLSAMTDRAITRRISEDGADRPRNLLSGARSRLGARRIAAACILGQQLAIRLPASRGQGIDALEALEGAGEPWTRPEIDQLLACGLFTAAWEGSVRFHHRRTMERLAAEAFDELLKGGMALDSLTTILTPAAFGDVTTPEPFVQTLGWLASLNPAFRYHVLQHAPQHLLDTGDPGSHPANVREEALRRHAARYARGVWHSEWFDDAMLRRFALPVLEDTCRDLLETVPAAEPKRLLLDIAEIAEFRGCLPEILDLIEDPAVEIDLRSRAVGAAAALGGQEELDRIRIAVGRFRPPASQDPHVHSANNHFRLQSVMACRPNSMTLSQALGVLLRFAPRHRQFVSSGDYDMAGALAASCPATKLPFLLRWLSRLCWVPSPRTFGAWDVPRWSDVGYHLLPALNLVVIRVINERSDLHSSPVLIDQLERLFAARSVSLSPLRHDEDDDTPDSLLAAVQGAPAVRQAIFFTATAIPSGRRQDEPGSVLERLGYRHGLLSDDAVVLADLAWMAEAYASNPAPRERKALTDAISYRLRVLRGDERRRQERRLKHLARDQQDQAALVEFHNARSRPLRDIKWAVGRFWRRQHWLHRVRQRDELIERAKIGLKLLWFRKAVRSGGRFDLLWNGTFGDQIHDEPIANAAKVYGPRAAENLASGMKEFARSYDGRARRGSWSARGHVALVGWAQIALDDPEAMTRLTPDEVRRAFSVAVEASNFPAWAAALAERHIAAFKAIVGPLVAEELAWTSGRLRYAEYLSMLSRQAAPVQQAMATNVLAGLVAGEPDPSVILPASKIIGTDDNLTPTLEALASRRFRNHIAEGQSNAAASWLAVWMERAPAAAWRALQDHRRAYAPHSDALVRNILGFMGEGAPLKSAAPDTLAEMAIAYLELFPPKDDDDANGETTHRHDAESLRGRIPGLIGKQSTPEARQTLTELASHPAFAGHPSWIPRVLRDQAVLAAAPKGWPPSDTAAFMGTFLKRPASVEEFRCLIERHIEAIAEDLATSEFDRRGLLRDVLERDVRAFFGDALQQRSQGWYSVTQETVTAAEKRTDLRVEGRTQAGEVVIVELKLAGGSWSGDQLVDHVETQLVDQYLISRRVRHGIYLVVDLGTRQTWTMNDGSEETFEGLVVRMRALAPSLLDRPTVDGLTILPLRIAVPKREPKPRKAKGKAADGT